MCDQHTSNDGRYCGSCARRERAPRQWIYQNLTPWRIEACFTDEGELAPRCTCDDGSPCDECTAHVLSIPALGEITVPHEDAQHLNTLNLRRLGQIELRPAPSELLTSLPRALAIFGWLLVGLVFGAWALFFGGASAVPWAWFVAAVVFVPVVALTVATVREIHLYRCFSRYRTSLKSPGKSLEGVQRGSRVCTFIDGIPRQAAEVTVGILAVVVAVVGLGVAIHQTTQLNEWLPIDYGAILQLNNPFTAVSELARSSPAFWQLVVGHIAQWVLVSIAALVPAAMYFQFDRQRLAALQRRWVQEVFRLDPTVRTVRDIEAKYGSQIEASFGELGPDSGLRLRAGRRSPVVVATILLVVGWFLVISTTHVPRLIDTSRGGFAGSPGPELIWSTGRSFPVSAFFRPDLTLVGYAFLGAYVFTLFHVMRGYQRRDLHPKTYNTIVVRILAAYALALVVSVVYDGPYAEVAMFFVGFMPQSAVVWLREKLAQDRGLWRLLPLHEPAPLTELEGIDLYDRTRLAEEGVNNVAALAHADIVELMSGTRISAAELVDWTDQAILYIRVGGDALAQDRDRQRTSPLTRLLGARRRRKPVPPPAGVASTNGDQPAPHVGDGAPADAISDTSHCPDVHRNLAHLRRFGIRTATDLLQVYEQALRRGSTAKSKAAEVRLLRSVLELPDPPQRDGVCTIQTIIDTLPDEEWFVQVRNWRCPEFGAADSWYSYLDGHDWTPRRARSPERVKAAMTPFRSIPMVDLDPTSSPATEQQLPSTQCVWQFVRDRVPS